MTMKEINAEYKRRFAELQEFHGETHLTFEQTRELGDWSRGQFEILKSERIASEAKELKEKPEGKNGVTPVVGSQRLCRTCSKPIAKTGKRGRPATICNPCKESK